MKHLVFLTLATCCHIPNVEFCNIQEPWKGIGVHKVDCDGLSGTETWISKLDKIVKHVNYVAIVFRHLKEVPSFPNPDTFKDVRTMVLEIISTTLPFLNAPGLKGNLTGFSEVGLLYLKDVEGLQNWNWSEMNEYTGRSVQHLKIINSRLVRLPTQLKDMYEEHVLKLTIVNSDLRWLDDLSLECRNCTSIDLSGNDIEDIRKEVYGEQKLDSLDLGY